MKTQITIAFALFAGLYATVAQADTILFRTDSKAGVSTQTYAVLTPAYEIWAFAPETKFSDLEIGKLVTVRTPKNTLLLAGGYYAIWPNQHQSFAIPYLLGKATVGKIQLAGTLGAYVPLSSGPRIVFIDEASAMTRTPKVQVGLAANLWSQDGTTIYRIGPKIGIDLGSGYSASCRYLRGPSAPDSFRFALSKSL